jgi:hypothetical protein
MLRVFGEKRLVHRAGSGLAGSHLVDRSTFKRSLFS